MSNEQSLGEAMSLLSAIDHYVPRAAKSWHERYAKLREALTQPAKSAEGERCAYQGCGDTKTEGCHNRRSVWFEHDFVAPGPAPEGKVRG